MSSMPDALSAAGLLLAAVALVYSAWSPQIDAAIDKSMGTTDGEISRSRDEVRAVRNQRAAPLLIAGLLILAAFLRRDIGIICSVKCAGQRGCTYDDIAAVFLLTQVLVGAFVIYLFGRIRQLNRKL
jgi:signal transduction histidine kinase